MYFFTGDELVSKRSGMKIREWRSSFPFDWYWYYLLQLRKILEVFPSEKF